MKPSLYSRKTEEYHYSVEGFCPVQAMGRVLGHPLYFRARWDEWTFTVCTSHNHPDSAVNVDGFEVSGFIEDAEYAGYLMSESYGENFDAGYMKIDDVHSIMERCLNRFMLEYQDRTAQQTKPPHHT